MRHEFYAALAIIAVVLQALRTYWAWSDHRSSGHLVGRRGSCRRERCPGGSQCGSDFTSRDDGD